MIYKSKIITFGHILPMNPFDMDWWKTVGRSTAPGDIDSVTIVQRGEKQPLKIRDTAAIIYTIVQSLSVATKHFVAMCLRRCGLTQTLTQNSNDFLDDNKLSKFQFSLNLLPLGL